MSFVLHGLAVSGGIAIGHAHLMSHATLEVAQYQIREREIVSELERFDHALTTLRSELDQLKLDLEATPGPANEMGVFVDLQRMFLMIHCWPKYRAI